VLGASVKLVCATERMLDPSQKWRHWQCLDKLAPIETCHSGMSEAAKTTIDSKVSL
jgi:hypothetical protein